MTGPAGGGNRASSIPGLLAARAAAQPAKVAIQLADGAGRLTFAAWERRSNRAARQLLANGVGHGDRIGLLFDSAHWVEFAVAYCAVQKAGAVAVPISEKATTAEVDHMFAACGASLAVSEGSEPASSQHAPRYVQFEQLDAGDDAGMPAVVLKPGDLAQILYTSGTEGKPKGVAASHENLTFGYEPAPRHRAFEHSEHSIHAFPIGTTAAQLMLLYAVTAHPTVLVLESFDVDRFCAAIERFAVGTAFLVPAMAIDLLNSKASERHDLSSVIALGSSGSALPPSVAHALTKAFPSASILNVYTSTEAMPAQVTMMIDPERPESVGLPIGTASLEIRGQDGTALPAGETGEVWLRCPTTPRTYYGDVRATATAFKDGWVRMGDTGWLDDDGHLYLLDRDSDIIKSGAMRVSTTEVEAALHEHPQVKDAAVIGLRHPVLGFMVAAAVVLDETTPLQQVRDFLRGRLARYKLPLRWAVVDELPRNQMGKVVKEDLRQLFESSPAGLGSVPRR
jgi:acyl-coenzyme A synthetase/AMP-(fatty) acid ligase